MDRRRDGCLVSGRPLSYRYKWDALSQSAKGEDEVALVLDTDWAPDFVLDEVAGKLIDARVRSTWFITHATPVLDRLRAHPDLFELGIHPNFLPGSTHGSSTAAVLAHCMALVPEAVSVRTHGLVQSTHLLAAIMQTTPIRLDASLYLPHTSNLQPVLLHWAGEQITRVPFVWEDDLEMYRPAPCWSVERLAAEVSGLKVLGFHPIHVYLNSSDLGPYERLKAEFGDLGAADPAEVSALRAGAPGSGTFFEALLDALAGGGRFIRDLEIA